MKLQPEAATVRVRMRIYSDYGFPDTNNTICNQLQGGSYESIE